MNLGHKRFLAASIALLGLTGIALAQTYFPTASQTIGTTDLIPDTPAAVPSAQSSFVTPAQIAGVPGYTYQVPVTAFSLTFANSQTDMILNPAGTLATGTLTTAAIPSDGQRECVLSSQTQTALTVTANTGQTINNAPTALVAFTPVCWTFVKATAAWNRSP